MAVLTGKELPLLVVILGPTASGKTALSVRLAEGFDGEVVSCDSVAVYRDFEIGTAKPTPDERRRVPHHLVDIASPWQAYSAGDYSRDARAAIAAITARGHLPIVTGGSGLYLRALLHGLFAGPARIDGLRERLRKAEMKRGPGYLHRVLVRCDAAAAAAIHANDMPKLIRAIEVSLSTGGPMTEAWSQGREALTGYRVLRIGLEPDRQLLYSRINQRAAWMFEHGLIEETQRLMAQYGPAQHGTAQHGTAQHGTAQHGTALKVFDTLGYRQAAAHLRGEYSAETALLLAQQGHRNYAKRQLTWFRKEPDVHWLPGFGDQQEIGEAAKSLIRDAS